MPVRRELYGFAVELRQAAGDIIRELVVKVQEEKRPRLAAMLKIRTYAYKLEKSCVTLLVCELYLQPS